MTATHKPSKKEITDNPKFYTKSGRLTAYAFACGYVEGDETVATPTNDRDGVTTELWKDGAYQVRQNDWRHGAFRPDTGHRVLWEGFHTLPEARARYDAACRDAARAQRTGEMLW
jgi:hypothetical protein